MKVVLEGGGSLGAFEVGVLKQLSAKGLLASVDEYIGTSTGALQACGMGFQGIKNLEQVWLGIKSTNDIYKAKDDFIPINATFDAILGQGEGILNSAPLRELINRMVVGKPTVPVTVCRVSEYTSMKQFITANPDGTFINVDNLQDFQKAVLASASTPGLVDLVDGEWGDGGLRDITPVDKAVADGATEILAILTQPFSERIVFQGRPGPIWDTIVRAFQIVMQQAFWNSVNAGKGIPGVKTTIYAPSSNLGDAFQFNPAEISMRIQQGENAIAQAI